MNSNTPPQNKERPILFSSPMVRAILDGRKTQTRRIIKPQPEDIGWGRNCEVHPYMTGTAWPLAYYEMRGACWNSSPPLKCAYGVPGDRLWVRETWALDPDSHPDEAGTLYRATDPMWDEDDTGLKWKPSIFMPRDRSRITLEVTSVRVQRLQSIGEEDAIAEGLVSDDGGWRWEPRDKTKPRDWGDWPFAAARGAYQELWEFINGEGSWERNPRVWAVTFRRV
jgi:hypothetical protein